MNNGNDNTITSPSYTSIFSSHEKKLQGMLIDGTTIFTIFGSFTLSASSSIIEDKTVLDVTAVFSNVTLSLPPDVAVEVKGTPIFGNLTDKRSEAPDERTSPTIIIRILCLFAEVTIR